MDLEHARRANEDLVFSDGVLDTPKKSRRETEVVFKERPSCIYFRPFENKEY